MYPPSPSPSPSACRVSLPPGRSCPSSPSSTASSALQLDLASIPSVFDRPFVMGQASPYRRCSAEGQLEEIEEESLDLWSTCGDEQQQQRIGESSSSRTPVQPIPFRRRFTALATPPASPDLDNSPCSVLRRRSPSPPRTFPLPPSPISPSLSHSPQLYPTAPAPRHRVQRKPPPASNRSLSASPARRSAPLVAAPPLQPAPHAAGRAYGGRKEAIAQKLGEYKSDVVLDPTNVKSPSSSAFWAGLDDDD